MKIQGMRLASHHRSFSYLADWLELDIVATLESKPGVPPSGAQLDRFESLGRVRRMRPKSAKDQDLPGDNVLDPNSAQY